MAGTAVARALTRRAAHRAARFEVALATAEDDRLVRRVLREHPLGGDIAVSLEREPHFHEAAGIEGDEHQTLVARDRMSGSVAAIASRSVRSAFLNGEPARLGYLGQFRVAAPYRPSRGLLEAGFACCRALHERGDASFYLVSIVADNSAARRLFSGLRCSHAPDFEEVGSLVSLIIPRSRRAVPAVDGIVIRRGCAEMMNEILACLARHGRRHQFAPCWTAADLASPHRTPGLDFSDFVVALRKGSVVGCLACWDQRRFKQIIVRGYSPRLARWRAWINRFGRFAGAPRLPEPGHELGLAYLSHVAIDDDRPDVAAALVGAARIDLPSGVENVVVGVPDGGALHDGLSKRFRHREYRTALYAAYWPDGAAVVRALDDRLPHPEVAVL